MVQKISPISDYRQSLKFQNLNEENRNIHLEVVRGGRRVEVSIYDILVGDVVPLNIGDQVRKDFQQPFLMSGCKVAVAYGSMLSQSRAYLKFLVYLLILSFWKACFYLLNVGCGNRTYIVLLLLFLQVTSVGVNTDRGLLMARISEDTGEETPLQVRLNGVANIISIVGLKVVVHVMGFLLLRYLTGHTKNTKGTAQIEAGETNFGDAIHGATKIVSTAVAVSEGLHLAVTLTLAYLMRKMMAYKALRTLVEAFVGGRKIDISDNNSDLSPMLSALLSEGIALNTNGNVYVPEKELSVFLYLVRFVL
ncbi:hypothetical protein L3X38_040998 [Prunus dulcis]|uniref:Uncharacterized protein n=1 Tax=Prunus dulcis TaxID=3755 RepID=A0AAD4US35_PRUDU|nr:hypothetical protein L3X38_040998 [Prunus dulcis]